MDEDSESGSYGLGNWAWYQFGRASVESEQATSRLLRNLFGQRRPPAIDVNKVLADNQALAAENDWLRQQLDKAERELDGYRTDYERLSEWADKAERNLKVLREKTEI